MRTKVKNPSPQMSIPKIVIIGDPESGKTALVRKTTSMWTSIHPYVPTLGATFFSINVGEEKEHRRVDVVDVAGRPELRCSQDEYIRGATGAIIIAREAQPYLDFLRQVCGPITVVIYSPERVSERALVDLGYQLTDLSTPKGTPVPPKDSRSVVPPLPPKDSRPVVLDHVAGSLLPKDLTPDKRVPPSEPAKMRPVPSAMQVPVSSPGRPLLSGTSSSSLFLGSGVPSHTVP